MDDMKDKLKGFMKKVNTQLSSSSSGKFKGQGRVLGTSSSSSSPATNPIHARYAQPLNTKPNSNISSTNSDKSSFKLSSSNSQSLPKNPPNSGIKKPTFDTNSTPNREPENGFDPFDSLITTGKRSQNGYSMNVFECPVCGKSYRSEEEVSLHIESCVGNSSVSRKNFVDSNVVVDDGDSKKEEGSENSELETVVGAYISVKPPEEKLEVMLKLLRNVVKEPENAKFRRIRMGNPKIREAVSEVTGGVELLEFVGFELKEESEELWAVIEDVPSAERIDLTRKAIGFLESGRVEKEPFRADDKPSAALAESKERAEPQKIDRQIRVFFSVPESVAAKIELPDSFYSLSAEELKREADMRKKKIAESQLLIPKSYKEKQAKAARKKYARTIIRIQFPDGVVLQGVFAPWESTSALYEFVSSALKDPSLEFELLDPILVKRRVIPHFPAAGERGRTLEDEDLVPSALIKFRPIESDSSVFTGLCNELLEISEPLN